MQTTSQESEAMSPNGTQEDSVPQASEAPAYESYAFVMNVTALSGEDSYRLAEGHELRRANTREVAEIKETLKDLPGFLSPWGGIFGSLLGPLGVGC